MIIKINSYLFSGYLNENIDKNINKFKNLSIIFNPENENSINCHDIKILRNYCKTKRIKFFYKNNIKLATQYKADGIYLSSDNKKFYKNLDNKKFQIIGTAHSQQEYFIKYNQGCEMVMLSPLFFNKKYPKKRILGVIKFNLITRSWVSKVGALGGILKTNLKKVYTTSAKSIGFIRLINNQT